MGFLDRFRDSPPPVTPGDQQPNEIGRTGTVNTRGFISQEEENSELRWPTNMKVYDKMIRTDPTVRWMLALQKVPVLAATYYCEPGGQEEEDLEASAFAEAMLEEELEGGLIGLLEKALRYLDKGHSVLERVYAYRHMSFEYQPKQEEGDEEKPDPVVVEKEMLIVARLAERLQRTIWRWNYVEGDSSKLESVTQFLGDGQEPSSVDIPADRLVVFTNEKEGDDWRGTSILRSAWRDWKYKVQLENLEAIAYERSTGIPVVYPPEGHNDSTVVGEIEDAVAGVRQGENLWIIMPGPKAATSVDANQGWLLEDFGIKGDDNASPDKAILRHKAGMAENILAEFMKLGHENMGARATGDVQQDPYYLAIQAIVLYVCKKITDEVIAPVVALNYSVKKPPALKASKIQAKNLKVVGEAMAALSGAGLIKADSELEEHLRDLFELPDKAPEPEEEEPPPGFLKLPDGSFHADPKMQPQVPGLPPAPQPQLPQKIPAPKAKTRSEWVQPRQLRESEKFVALSEISKLLDNGDADLIEMAQRAGEESVRETESAMNTAVAAKSAAAVAEITVNPAPIATAIDRVLAGLYEKGREQVRAELRKQSGSVKLASPRGLVKDFGTKLAQQVVEAVAKSAAESVANAATRAIRQRAIRTIQDGSVPTGAGFDPMAALRAEAQRAAQGVVSAAFNLGRSDEAMLRSEDISHSEYSAVLDPGTCSPCAEADGTIGPPGGLPELPTPNPNCYGGGACRCIWIYIAK
jgi:hypothetical protein